MSEIILTTKEELRNVLRSVIIEEESKKAALETPKLFTINQVAKKLGKAHSTIKKFVDSGVMKSTASGQITEQSINNYLNNI